MPSITDYVDLSSTSKGVSDNTEFSSFHRGIVGIASNGDDFPRFFKNSRYLERSKEILQSLKTSSFLRMQNNWYSMAIPNLFAASDYLLEDAQEILKLMHQSRMVGVSVDLAAMTKTMTKEAATAKIRARFQLLRDMTKRENAKLFVATDDEEIGELMENEFGDKVMRIKGVEKFVSEKEISEEKLKMFFMELAVLGKMNRLVLTRNSEIGTLALYAHVIAPRIHYF